MKCSRKFILAWIAMCLIVATVGHIAKAAPFGAVEWQDYSEAQAYWQLPEPNCEPVEGEIVPRASLPPSAVGQLATPCLILVAEALPPCFVKEVIYHETGHLDGLVHSTDPASIMYPLLTGQLGFCFPLDGKITGHAPRRHRRAHRAIRRDTI